MKVDLPESAGCCAYDRDECTVTIALDNAEQVRALVLSLKPRNRVWLAPEDDAA